MKIFKNHLLITFISAIVLYLIIIVALIVNIDMSEVNLVTEYGDANVLEDMGVKFKIYDGINSQKLSVFNGNLIKEDVVTVGYENTYCGYKGDYTPSAIYTMGVDFSLNEDNLVCGDIGICTYSEGRWYMDYKDIHIDTDIKLISMI